MFDAETGEELILTKSRWNGREGRVNLDFKGIIGTGTGTLDVGYIKGADEMLPLSASEPNHPLTKKFLEDGPLNPFFHIRWNPRTGRVEPLTSNTPKKKKRKSNKKKIIVEEVIDDESSVGDVKIDPFAFLNRKKKLGSVVDLALQQRETIQATPISPPTSAQNSTALPPISSNFSQKSFEESPLSTSRIKTEQIVFNQIYSLMSEIDDISHPKPYRPNGMTRAEKLSWNRLSDERKLNIVKQCEELAALKTRMARELKQAIHDEEVREKKREEAIKDLRNPNSKIAKELSKRHKEERERGRLYIRQLQYDNEIIFLSKVRECNILW